MTALTSVTARQIIPNCEASFYVLTYSKASATDYLTVTTETPIKNIRFALATDDGAGAEDPVSYSATVVTMSAGTGAGRVIVIGNC